MRDRKMRKQTNNSNFFTMKKNYMAVAIAAMIFTGCSNVEMEGTDPNPVSEIAKLEFGSVVSIDGITRAPKDLAANFTINLTADAGAPTVYTAEKNLTVTYDVNKYELGKDIYITDKGRTLTAWAPTNFVPDAGNENLFTLTAGVYSADKDFIYQKKTISTAELPVAIAMKHVMSKITFKFVYPDNNTPKTIKNFSVIGCEASNTFDISAEKWGDTPVAAADIELIPEAGESIANDNQKKSVIVLPKTSVAEGTLKIKLTVNEKESGELNLSGITELKAATDYLVTISISDKKVSIDSVQDMGWTDETGGTVTIE